MKTVAIANDEFDDLEVQLLSAIGPKELSELVTDKKHHELIIHS
ncbi:MAG: hypothetical protein IEMM0008_1680 [bacterium]|nr:MAG: hypothetical protein IEMM0008_1680 [bacterium]